MTQFVEWEHAKYIIGLLEQAKRALTRFETVGQKAMAQSAEHPGSWGSNATLQRLAAKEFSRALGKAQRAADKSDPELAIGWCRYAASLAWGVNPGFFYSHEMEQLLGEIGRRYLGPAPTPPPGQCPPSPISACDEYGFGNGRIDTYRCALD